MKSEERAEELINEAKFRNMTAVCLTETWRDGFEKLEHDPTGCMILMSGMDEDKNSKRGSQGTGFWLSKAGVKAWKKAGSYFWVESARVSSLTLMMMVKGKEVNIQLISGYAPTSADSNEARLQWYDDLDRAKNRVNGDVITIMGVDGNASIGVQDEGEDDDARGPHGIKHTNEAGRQLLQYVSLRNMYAVSTKFKQKKGYGTWKHMRNGNMYQLDHFFIQREYVPFVQKCLNKSSLLSSDHLAVSLVLRCSPFKGKKSSQPDELSVPKGLDQAKLRPCTSRHDPQIERKFVRAVKDELQKKKVRWNDRACEDLSEAAIKAAKLVLPKREKRQPTWWEHSNKELTTLREIRKKWQRI